MNPNEINIEDLEQVTGGEQVKGPGIYCGLCGAFIPISMYQIITNASVFCPNCKTRYDLDPAGPDIKHIIDKEL